MNFKTSAYLLSTVLLLLLLVSGLLYIPLWWILLPPAIWFILLTIGAFNIQLDFFLKAVHSVPLPKGAIALSFDDGPHPGHTTEVLRILRQYHIKATFFCIGKHIQQYPELIRQIAAGGHAIGNHSYSHGPFIDFGSKKQWIDELEATDALITQYLHKKPALFRPPYGVTTPHLAKAVRHTGHRVIGWNVRPYDTRPQPADRIVRRILAQIKPGSIILLHDTHERIIPVLEQLLPQLIAKKYNFATLEQFTQPLSDI